MFQKGSELVLDDNRRYEVTECISVNGADYLCLMGIDGSKKQRLVKQINNNGEVYIKDVEDKKELLDLMEACIKLMKRDLN